MKSLLLLGSFGNFTNVILSGGFLDDSDSDGLLHVSYGKSSERLIL
jgi:predicted GH43/DUF377 family glycosyl hydrolase